jgi:hypothetical protein
VDATRFDALTRAIDRLSSRRAGLGAALLLDRFASDAKRRKKKRKKKKCKGATRKCGKRCVPLSECCSAADCPPQAICDSGACICANPAETACNEACVDLLGDVDHCGACGHACFHPEELACRHGACECTQDSDCGGSCACGARLEGGAACTGGAPVGDRCTTDDDCPGERVCTLVGVCSCTGDADCPAGSPCLGVEGSELEPFCGGPCAG